MENTSTPTISKENLLVAIASGGAVISLVSLLAACFALSRSIDAQIAAQSVAGVFQNQGALAMRSPASGTGQTPMTAQQQPTQVPQVAPTAEDRGAFRPTDSRFDFAPQVTPMNAPSSLIPIVRAKTPAPSRQPDQADPDDAVAPPANGKVVLLNEGAVQKTESGVTLLQAKK